MFNIRTEDEIKRDMLKNVKNTVDKTENSIVHDALSPAAIELQNAYVELDYVSGKIDVENLEGEELEKFIYQRTGTVVRKHATKSTGTVVVSGQEGAVINIGDIVATEDINFYFIEDVKIDETGIVEALVECELEGSSGNVPAYSIINFPTKIPGVIDVYNPSEFNNGYDDETDDQLRGRYYEKLQIPAKAGNKYHYEHWAREVLGVGDVRVIPRWKTNRTMSYIKNILDNILMNGSYIDEDVTEIINTSVQNALSVKIVLIDSNNQPASEELAENVLAHIESQRPFGAYPTVVSATPIEINISANLILAEGYTDIKVKENIINNIKDYLRSIAFKTSYVSYAKIGSTILNSEGILDYTDLLVNNSVANIPIGNEEIAVMGVINGE